MYFHGEVIIGVSMITVSNNGLLGQLGISEHQPDAYKPVEITFFRGKNVKEVVAGSNFSLCLTGLKEILFLC